MFAPGASSREKRTLKTLFAIFELEYKVRALWRVKIEIVWISKDRHTYERIVSLLVQEMATLTKQSLCSSVQSSRAPTNQNKHEAWRGRHYHENDWLQKHICIK